MSFCTLRCYSYIEAGISVFCRTEAKQIEKQYDAITVPRFTDCTAMQKSALAI